MLALLVPGVGMGGGGVVASTPQTRTEPPPRSGGRLVIDTAERPKRVLPAAFEVFAPEDFVRPSLAGRPVLAFEVLSTEIVGRMALSPAPILETVSEPESWGRGKRQFHVENIMDDLREMALDRALRGKNDAWIAYQNLKAKMKKSQP